MRNAKLLNKHINKYNENVFQLFIIEELKERSEDIKKSRRRKKYGNRETVEEKEK